MLPSTAKVLPSQPGDQVDGDLAGDAVEGEVAGGRGGDLLAVGRHRAELDRRGEHEGGGRELVDLHDAVLELAVAPRLAALEGGHVHLEGGRGDGGALDRDLAGDALGAADGLGVLAEERLVDPVADDAAVGHRPGALDALGRRAVVGGGAVGGGRGGDVVEA